MAKLTLYHAAPSRSSIGRWMLEEVGEPYDIHLLNLSKGDTHAPDYLAVNPMGKVPALKHGDTVITEAAAICAYLADEFPRAKLNVSQTLNFRAPVRIGDRVDVTVTVAELIPARQRARLACSCKVGDEIVLDGE